MMSTVTEKTGAFGMMATIVPMPPTMKKPRWSIGIPIDTFMEEASAKGYAAMGGYQCGVKGAAVVDADALLRDRNADRGFFPLPDASSAYWR